MATDIFLVIMLMVWEACECYFVLHGGDDD